jgi:hypothetical protein
MELNEYGLNAALTASILPSRQDMRTLGFTERSGATWGLCRPVGTGVTLDLSIPKDGSPFRLDIIDEKFRKPYDYQGILRDYPDDECALGVQKDVEHALRFLSKVRIIQGFETGVQIPAQKDKILV